MRRVGTGGDDRGGVAAAVPVAVLGIVPLQGSETVLVFGGSLLILAIFVAATAVEVVDDHEKRALIVSDEYRKMLEPGVHFVPPLVSETTTIDVRPEPLEVSRQKATTADGTTVFVEAVVEVRVVDAEKAFLETADYRRAVSNLVGTTVRAVLGEMELYGTPEERREVNERTREELAEPVAVWGIRVESVDVQRITTSSGDVLFESRSGAATGPTDG